jgi:hypothetical protein
MPPAGQGRDKEFFAGTMLLNIINNRALSRPKSMVTHAFLHFDNAGPHLASDKYNKYDKFGIKRLPHPPHSPELAPCDFWRF